jgi:hypothetical protein
MRALALPACLLLHSAAAGYRDGAVNCPRL